MKKRLLFALSAFALFVLGIEYWSWSEAWPRSCEPGPLTQVESCQTEHGWWGTDFAWWTQAEGPINPSQCEGLLSIRNMPRTGIHKMHSVPCASYLADSQFEKCGVASRLTSSGDPFFALIASNAACTRGLFFEGRERALVKGRVVPFSIEQFEEFKDLYPQTRGIPPELIDMSPSFYNQKKKNK